MVNIFPELINATKGGHAEFNCLASGVGTTDFEYQWFLNQLRIPDQNTPTLIINDVTYANGGDYICSVRNPYKGIGHSGVAKLFISGIAIIIIIFNLLLIECSYRSVLPISDSELSRISYNME